MSEKKVKFTGTHLQIKQPSVALEQPYIVWLLEPSVETRFQKLILLLRVPLLVVVIELYVALNPSVTIKAPIAMSGAECAGNQTRLRSISSLHGVAYDSSPAVHQFAAKMVTTPSSDKDESPVYVDSSHVEGVAAAISPLDRRQLLARVKEEEGEEELHDMFVVPRDKAAVHFWRHHGFDSDLRRMTKLEAQVAVVAHCRGGPGGMHGVTSWASQEMGPGTTSRLPLPRVLGCKV